MRAVITVVGKDSVGILAKVSAKCAESNVNINEVTQSVLENMFCMIMLVKLENNVKEVSMGLDKIGEEMGLSIHVQREEIFESMHRI